MLDKVWEVKPCLCEPLFNHPEGWKCGYVIIPGVADQQGALDRAVAQHIVDLHNRWLEEINDVSDIPDIKYGCGSPKCEICLGDKRIEEIGGL